jgi:Mor family transcriptional regulator
MQLSATEMFEAWQKGESIGSLAKRYNMDKFKVRRIINRVAIQSRCGSTEVLQQLQADKSIDGRDV